METILNDLLKPDSVQRTCQRLKQLSSKNLIQALIFIFFFGFFAMSWTYQIVRKSNVVYESAFFQTGYMHIPPYVTNGILGGCFDHMGFQSMPNKDVLNGRTILGYILGV